MAWTQSDLDKLKAALVKGGAVAEVTHNGKKVVYRGVREIREAIELIERELSTKPKTQRVFAKFSKGTS